MATGKFWYKLQYNTVERGLLKVKSDDLDDNYAHGRHQLWRSERIQRDIQQCLRFKLRYPARLVTIRGQIYGSSAR